MRSHRFLVFAGALVLFVVVLFARQESTENEPELNAGIKAYEDARYEDAKQHFALAVAHDPANVKAHLYLGAAYAQEYIPGADSPENNVLGQRAIEQYKIVLELDAECWSVREANKEHVESGIEMLNKAIELRHDYDDAMAYMNLMYRERADIQCGDAKANAEDLKTADKWLDVTLAVKKVAEDQKKKREMEQGGSSVTFSITSPQ